MSYTVTFRFTFGAGGVDASSPPSLVGVLSFPQAERTVAYSYNARSIFSGSAPMTFAVNGVLPDGITFDANTCVFGGTPTKSGIFSGISITATNAFGTVNSNTDGITVTEIGFTYDLTMPLVDGTGTNAGYKMVYNTKTSAYDARIEDYPAGTQPNPSDWNTVYPDNGTLDDAYQINTLVTLPSNASYDMQIPYNDDTVAGTFDLALIKYHGDGTADRWDGDQDTTPIAGGNGEAGLLYSPPVSDYVIHENPSLPKTPTAYISNISDGTEGDAAQTIQVSFNVEPLGLALGDFTSSANVSLSNLIAVGWDGAGQYIYNLDVSFVSASGSETISLNGSSGQYTDQFNNPSASDAVSNTFVISAATSGNLIINGDFSNGTTGWFGTNSILISVDSNGMMLIDGSAVATDERAESEPQSNANYPFTEDLIPNQSYTLNFDFIRDGSTANQEFILWETGGAAWIKHSSSTTGTGQSLTFTTASDSTEWKFWIIVRAGGQAWIDNLELRKN